MTPTFHGRDIFMPVAARLGGRHCRSTEAGEEVDGGSLVSAAAGR